MDSVETAKEHRAVDCIRGFELLREKVRQFFRSYYSRRPEKSENGLVRFEIEIGPVDLLSWLQSQRNPHKIYWSGRDHTLEIVGVGAANIVSGSTKLQYSEIIERLQKYLLKDNNKIHYYGGTRFSENNAHDAIWNPFGSYWFCVPRFEITTRDNATFCACNILMLDAQKDRNLPDTVAHEFDAINFEMPEQSSNGYKEISRKDFPEKSAWSKNVLSALDSIAGNVMGKIVLARKSTIEFAHPVDSIPLLRKLKLINPDSFHFYIQPASGHAFLGESPERLYRRDNRQIFSEAVAGTRIRGNSDSEDEMLEQELLTSEKDLREHNFVHQSVKQALEKLCNTIRSSRGIQVVKLARIQHLFSSFLGTLSNGIEEADIISALHPTPAVGGVPTKVALRKLWELESFDRGWYAGPVGWIGPNHAEFAVAIRSGLMHGNKLTLFSGAGIVTGSEPLGEWEEIENKINNFLKILNGA
jgi:menaquinone-specific isochorismate synthase